MMALGVFFLLAGAFIGTASSPDYAMTMSIGALFNAISIAAFVRSHKTSRGLLSRVALPVGICLNGILLLDLASRAVLHLTFLDY